MNSQSDLLQQLDRHLGSAGLTWLFGAGISYDARIPLMKPLTARVMAVLRGERSPCVNLLESLHRDLPTDSHIEHLLSHLGDHAALAIRSQSKQATVDGSKIDLSDLQDAHRAVTAVIGQTIRWGYESADDSRPENIGSPSNPIIAIEGHTGFVKAAFRTVQAGLQERRMAVRIFTMNYDTLLEDALALNCVPYWDGFQGGAVAFRDHRFGEVPPETGARAHVIKLHGSIDWHVEDDGKVRRIRAGDTYPEHGMRVLIYPQATKYIATQRDPFATQFDLFRRTLAAPTDNVLAVCGYSFSDEHINQEIELALGHEGSKTTLLAFCRGGATMPECLTTWRNGPWGPRVYVVSEEGIYAGAEGPYVAPPAGAVRDWWTFRGVTKLLRDGVEGSI